MHKLELKDHGRIPFPALNILKLDEPVILLIKNMKTNFGKNLFIQAVILAAQKIV